MAFTPFHVVVMPLETPVHPPQGQLRLGLTDRRTRQWAHQGWPGGETNLKHDECAIILNGLSESHQPREEPTIVWP